MTSGLETEWAY